jgi:hypothetical protein
VWILRGIRSLKQERAPVSDKLLRSAGESLSTEIEKLDEQVNDIFVWTFFGPALFTAMVILGSGAHPIEDSRALAMIVSAAAIVFVFLVWRLIYLINRRRDYRLGFAGERAVAEELNQLMLDGCRVFHDVPMEPYGNIDHVLVAPAGIYAVETKARRKRTTSKAKPDHEVTCDGKTLHFPTGADSRALDQAKLQANRLRLFLSDAVGEPVKVSGILTFPGWFVTSRVKAEIKVLNPRQIRTAVLNNQVSTMPKQLIDRVVHQLDRKCRDVEF